MLKLRKVAQVCSSRVRKPYRGFGSGIFRLFLWLSSVLSLLSPEAPASAQVPEPRHIPAQSIADAPGKAPKILPQMPVVARMISLTEQKES